ncbi:hypothetical protein NL676_018197 [Syzygium grande]|nr:hypothetical protein NL676_018197 [Syzygium grande]
MAGGRSPPLCRYVSRPSRRQRGYPGGFGGPPQELSAEVPRASTDLYPETQRVRGPRQTPPPPGVPPSSPPIGGVYPTLSSPEFPLPFGPTRREPLENTPPLRRLGFPPELRGGGVLGFPRAGLRDFSLGFPATIGGSGFLDSVPGLADRSRGAADS